MKFKFARDALKYLIKTYNIREIYLPYYLCHVMRHAVFEANCKPIFYHIKDYFGICDKNIDKLIKIYPKLIIDNAHAFYSKPRGFASFNSAKKFLPVKDGAYLWIGKGKEITPPSNQRYLEFMKYHNVLKDNVLKIDISKDTIPFCYPYLAPSIEIADNLVDQLTKQGKTIYRYWNTLPKSYNEYKFYIRLVPIPL